MSQIWGEKLGRSLTATAWISLFPWSSSATCCFSAEFCWRSALFSSHRVPTSRRSAPISSARVGVFFTPVLTHGLARHTSGINTLRERTRYLWLFGLTASYQGVVGSYPHPTIETKLGIGNLSRDRMPTRRVPPQTLPNPMAAIPN
jgi:hypothetical protein